MEAMKETTTPDPRIARILETYQALGGNSRDVRDVVHELFHALTVADGDWPLLTEREELHDALLDHFGEGRGGLAKLWVNELKARAAEQVACARLGVAIEPVEVWIDTSIMEAIKFGLGYDRRLDEAAKTARRFMSDPTVLGVVDAILLLGGE